MIISRGYSVVNIILENFFINKIRQLLGFYVIMYIKKCGFL